MGALASDLLRTEIWQDLVAQISEYRDGTLSQLLLRSDDLGRDNEKRAIVFAFDRVIEYPHRLIENGQRARRALDESAKAASLRSIEDRAQAVETLGFHQALD